MKRKNTKKQAKEITSHQITSTTSLKSNARDEFNYRNLGLVLVDAAKIIPNSIV